MRIKLTMTEIAAILLITFLFNMGANAETKLEPRWKYPYLSIGRTVIDGEATSYSNVGYRYHHGQWMWGVEHTSNTTDTFEFKGYGMGFGYHPTLNKALEPYIIVGGGLSSTNSKDGIYQYLETGVEITSRKLIKFQVGFRKTLIDSKIPKDTNTIFLQFKTEIFN